MKIIEHSLPWQSNIELLEIDSSSKDPDVVAVAATYKIDGLSYVLAQKKDYGWPIQPGAFTLFGGQVEANETAAAAIRREINEELGEIFSTGIDLVPACDITASLGDKPSKGYRLYVAHLGNFTYPEWIEKQATISLAEGIGMAGWTLKELSNYPNLFVSHDRDFMAFAIQQTASQ